MSPPHILIVGGGIGGLALAQGLRKHNILFTLFERDPSPVSRTQGYRIRIAGPGAEALDTCLSDDLFDLFDRTCAQFTLGMARLNALDGAKFPEPNAGGFRPGQGKLQPWMKSTGVASGKVKDAYTVDRTIFRALLLLEQEKNVEFGKAFVRYEIIEGGVRAFFADGTSADGTLLIGADGVASPVRKQLLPQQRYVDIGSRVIYGKTPITDELNQRYNPEAMKCMTIIKGPDVHRAVFLEPVRFTTDVGLESNGRLQQVPDYIYWVFSCTPEDTGMSEAEFYAMSSPETANLTVKLTREWDPTIRPLFELQATEQAAALRITSAKLDKPDWKSCKNVTLLGDAVHAMLPAGGSGANCALADAALLLKKILEKGVTAQGIAEYEDEMWEYALEAMKGSAIGGAKLLGFKGFEGAKEVVL